MSKRVRGGEPGRWSEADEAADLEGASASSMVRDLRIARAAKPASYDVDAGLARFSAIIAVAPAVGGGAGAAGGAGVGTGAGDAVTTAAGGSGVIAGGITKTGATAAGVALGSQGAAGGALVATGASAAASKAVVATGLGASVKAALAVVVATGTIGVAGYELTRPPIEGPAVVSSAASVAPRTSEVAAPKARGPMSPSSSRTGDGLAPAVVEPSVPEAAIEPGLASPSSSNEARADVEPSHAPGAERATSPSSTPATPSATPLDRAAPSSNAAVASSVKPEMDQLARARRASSPDEALRLAEEGHRAFPRGVFWQEREAIAIDALSRLGRPEAAPRARAFVARNPESAYAEQFRRIAGD